MRRAFTLIEVLICIAIVAVLAAIVMPVFITAKRSALMADETSRLRQLGVAFGLYESDNDRQQYGVSALEESGYVPRTILSSALDPTVEGIANNIAKDVHGRLPHFNEEVPYRSSFPSFLVFGQFNDTFSRVREKNSAGWLVSLSGTKTRRANVYADAVEGVYLRLLLDGAVVRRKTSWLSLGGDSGELYGYSPYFLFADFTEAEKREQLFGDDK